MDHLDTEKQKQLCAKFAQQGLPFAYIATTQKGLSAISEFYNRDHWVPGNLRNESGDIHVISEDLQHGVIAFPTLNIRKWARNRMPIASLFGHIKPISPHC